MRLFALTLLCTTLCSAQAANPNLDCKTLEVAVPGEAEEVLRPKGFQWTGFEPVGVLSDGRAVISRDASLENLPRRLMKAQHDSDYADRVMQVIAVNPDASVSTIGTLRRGTLVEIAAMPGDRMLLARAGGGGTVLALFGPDNKEIGMMGLPEDPQGDKQWRYVNSVKGTAKARLHALSHDRIASWFNGRSAHLDLLAGTLLASPEAWPLDRPVVFNKRGEGEMYLVNRHKDLLRIDSRGDVVETLPCAECRVVGVGAADDKSSYSLTDGAVAVVKAEGSTLAVRWLKGEGKSTGKPARLEAPQGIDGRTWTWAARSGPQGTALITTSDNTDEGRQHVVWAMRPDSSEPAWSLTVAPDASRGGERLVADALGPYVRLRLTKGEGKDESVRVVKLVDMRSNASTDWTKPSDLSEELRRVIALPWHQHGHRDGGLLRVAKDPLFERIPRGPSTATFEWCKVVLED